MQPLAYHVTITCYGQRLPGDDRGTVDPNHNVFGTPLAPGNPAQLAWMQHQLTEPPFALDIPRGKVVLESIQYACRRFGWKLWMAHSRVTHFHTAVTADATPNVLRTQLKAKATKFLKNAGFDLERRKRWVKGGSVRPIFDQAHLQRVIEYGARKQGEPMVVFVAGEGTWVSDGGE
ncbi:MAG: hypothetical protein RL885_20850 [Planctomycetota bacterium]